MEKSNSKKNWLNIVEVILSASAIIIPFFIKLIWYLFHKNEKTILGFLSHVDWLNTIIDGVMCFLLILGFIRLRKLTKKIDIKDKASHSEIEDDIFPEIVRLSYRMDCIRNNEKWDYEMEKKIIEDYFKINKKRSIQELEELMQKHFPDQAIKSKVYRNTLF